MISLRGSLAGMSSARMRTAPAIPASGFLIS